MISREPAQFCARSSVSDSGNVAPRALTYCESYYPVIKTNSSKTALLDEALMKLHCLLLCIMAATASSRTAAAEKPVLLQGAFYSEAEGAANSSNLPASSIPPMNGRPAPPGFVRAYCMA